MSTLAPIDKINTALSTLEAKYGENIPLADLRQSLADAFKSTPTLGGAGPVSSSEQCASLVKDGSKQCSKKGNKLGSDGKNYCTQHFNTAFPDEATPAAPKSAKASKPAATKTATAAAKKPVCKVSSGTPKPGVNPPCDHDIKGTNPRKCGKGGKEKGKDGKWYCGTHVKSHQSGGPSVANDNAAEAAMAAAMQPSEIAIDDIINLAVDQNGLCYVADWEGNGVSVVARVTGGVVGDITETDITFCNTNGFNMVPPADRTRIIAMTPEERQTFMSGEAAPGVTEEGSL